MSMSKLLGKATEQIRCLQPTANKNHLILRAIDRIDTLRHFLADLDRAGSVVNKRLEQKAVVTSHIPAILGLGVGLTDIEHLFGVVAHADRTVLLGELLTGFQKDNSDFALLDIHAVLSPIFGVSKLGCLRPLRRDEKGVAHRIAVKVRLDIQIRLEERTVVGHVLGGRVDQSESIFALLLLLRCPFLLIERGIALFVRLHGLACIENVIIVCHDLSLLFLFLLGHLDVLRPLRRSVFRSLRGIRPLSLFLPDLLHRLSHRLPAPFR